MASTWINQCKQIFKTKADGLLWREKIQSDYIIAKIITTLSADSEIPDYILWRWWNEEETKKKQNLSKKLCVECGKNIIAKQSYKGKIYKTGKYVGLCRTCIIKKRGGRK